MPRKKFISVALGIQIPFDSDEISAKAMSNPHPQNDLVQVRNNRYNNHFS